jgi:sarcosine oxidase
MTNEYDVIVVGIGTMGAATCYELACRDKRVLGVEQFDIPHTRGAHHGFSRMFRLAYFEHPDYVALLQRAYDLWQKIARDSGLEILNVTGGLYMGRPDSQLVAGSLESAKLHNLEHDLLDRKDAAKRYPMFHLPDGCVAMVENKAGFVHPERAVATYAEQALRRGAEIHGNEPVIGWEPTAAGVTVRTARGEYRAERVVFCGGAWSSPLLDGLNVELKVTRQILAWFWPRRPELFSLDNFPCWALDLQPRDKAAGLHYGFPMLPSNPGFKMARHFPGRPADPDTVDRSVLDGDIEELRPVLRDVIPDADGPMISHRTCLYTNSADGHFIVDFHPQCENVIIACGFSGHGFKFASVMGEALADLAADGRSDLPIDFLSLKRFDR